MKPTAPSLVVYLHFVYRGERGHGAHEDLGKLAERLKEYLDKWHSRDEPECETPSQGTAAKTAHTHTEVHEYWLGTKPHEKGASHADSWGAENTVHLVLCPEGASLLGELSPNDDGTDLPQGVPSWHWRTFESGVANPVLYLLGDYHEAHRQCSEAGKFTPVRNSRVPPLIVPYTATPETVGTWVHEIHNFGRHLAASSTKEWLLRTQEPANHGKSLQFSMIRDEDYSVGAHFLRHAGPVFNQAGQLAVVSTADASSFWLNDSQLPYPPNDGYRATYLESQPPNTYRLFVFRDVKQLNQYLPILKRHIAAYVQTPSGRKTAGAVAACSMNTYRRLVEGVFFGSESWERPTSLARWDFAVLAPKASESGAADEACEHSISTGQLFAAHLGIDRFRIASLPMLTPPARHSSGDRYVPAGFPVEDLVGLRPWRFLFWMRELAKVDNPLHTEHLPRQDQLPARIYVWNQKTHRGNKLCADDIARAASHIFVEGQTRGRVCHIVFFRASSESTAGAEALKTLRRDVAAIAQRYGSDEPWIGTSLAADFRPPRDATYHFVPAIERHEQSSAVLLLTFPSVLELEGFLADSDLSALRRKQYLLAGDGIQELYELADSQIKEASEDAAANPGKSKYMPSQAIEEWASWRFDRRVFVEVPDPIPDPAPDDG